MPRVMLIEDEPVLRSSIARYLGRVPGLSVVDTGLVADALRLLETERPDLVVSDLDLPDGSGLEVLAAFEALGGRPPFIFVTGHLGTFRDDIPRGDDVEIYEKPFPLSDLREAVLRRLAVDSQRPDRPSPFDLRDYVQLACMGGHTVDLEVLREGVAIGRIRVHGGALWAASIDDLTGEAALARLLGLAMVSTRIVRRSDPPGDRHIERHWPHVLLDIDRDRRRAAVARRQPAVDTLLDGDVPPPAAPPPPPADDEDFPALLDRGLDAMLARDFATAWSALSRADALRPGVGTVQTNLARLRALGVGDDAGAPAGE